MKSANPEESCNHDFPERDGRCLGCGLKLKAQGMEVVRKHTSATWYMAMFDAAKDLLRTKGRFTSEDLVAVVGEPPGHPSAVGATTSAIAKTLGLRPIGRTNSRKPRSHAAELKIWGQ